MDFSTSASASVNSCCAPSTSFRCWRSAATAIAAAAATVWVGFPLAWLPWAVALGVAVHIAGDRVPGHREPIAVALCLAALAAWPYRAHLGALIEGVNA